MRRVSARERIGPLLLVLGLGAVLYLPGLGREILRHPLEAKYAMAAREMVRGGPWLVAHLFGQIYPDKPPLYFWATAGVTELRGGHLDEVSARLPAVAGALATLTLTLALGDALFGARVGLVSATVLATSGLFFWYARQGHPDQFLIGSVTLACLGLWRSFTTPAGSHRTAWVALAYAAMALGVMSKGLLGLVLPLLAGGLYLALTGPLRAMPGRVGLWPGLPVFLAVVLGWYGPAVARHGMGYLRETLVHQQVERYARSWVHHGPWYQYFGDFTVGFLPWSLFVPAAVALAWPAWGDVRDRRRAARAPALSPGTLAATPVLFPLCWFVAGFVFFSLSTGKRTAYLLPLYPAAALLVGWTWSRAMAEGRGSRWLEVPVGLLAGTAAVLAAGVLVLPRRLIPGRMVDTLVPATLAWQVVAAVTLLAGSAAVWLTWRRGRPGAAFVAIVAATTVCFLGVTLVRAPQYERRYPARELATRLAAHVPPGEPVLSLLHDYDFLVAFYLDRPITQLPGPSELLAARRTTPRLALLDNDDRALLTEPGVTVVAEGRLGPKRIVLVRLDKHPG
jgi:4-amino-4-deoxy-L-arabinose transferase-like glycosyltransferase